jgi:hypothetical protein
MIMGVGGIQRDLPDVFQTTGNTKVTANFSKPFKLFAERNVALIEREDYFAPLYEVFLFINVKGNS